MMALVNWRVGVINMNPFVLVVGFLLLNVLFLLGYRLYRDRNIIQNGGEMFSLRKWWHWRRWSLRRMYRQFKSYLLIGKISSHIFMMKSLSAFGLIAGLIVAMQRYAPTSTLDQQILVAATTFYATMLYFDGRFQFAALRYQNQNVTICSSYVDMDMVQISLELYNDGAITAEHIEAEMTVIDPVRERSTWSHDAEIGGLNDSKENATDSLKPSYSRDITFSFIPSENEIERIRMEDSYGIDPWAKIRITSPEQMTTTWIYVPLRKEGSIDISQLAESAQMLGQAVKLERERILGNDTAGPVISENSSTNRNDEKDAYIPPGEIL